MLTKRIFIFLLIALAITTSGCTINTTPEDTYESTGINFCKTNGYDSMYQENCSNPIFICRFCVKVNDSNTGFKEKKGVVYNGGVWLWKE